jgi:hypothetical protein
MALVPLRVTALARSFDGHWTDQVLLEDVNGNRDIACAFRRRRPLWDYIRRCSGGKAGDAHKGPFCCKKPYFTPQLCFFSTLFMYDKE